MKRATVKHIFAVLMTTAACAAALAAEQVTYTGSATFVVTRVTLPLANGGAAIHMTNDIVATSAGS